MVCGFGESIGYVNLVRKITGDELDKGARFTDWSRRPLSTKQLSYALADVTHLRDVYLHLSRELDATDRAHWVAEEMATLTAPATYESHPEDAWRRLKMRVKSRRALAILMELAAWRERQAQVQDVPRGRILRDEALYDIANQAFDAMQGTISRAKLAAYPPDKVVTIPRNACGTLEFDRAAEMIDLGYEMARTQLANGRQQGGGD